MRLPNAEHARVDRAKVVDYLLSPVHVRGKAKAEFFLRFGFSADRWEEFAEALRVHAASNEVVNSRETGTGTSYAVEGIMNVPDGRNPSVRAVWEIGPNAPAPRLISAYPTPRRG